MITIGAAPSSDFTDPLGLLSDCHRRIERFLGLLIIVCEQARGGSLNDDQREALDTALRYFRKASPLHNADEEESLFPRMRTAGSQELIGALEALHGLEDEHRGSEAMLATVDELGTGWLENDALPATELDKLVSRLFRLRSVYERHIGVEDREIFPLAGRLLPPPTIQQIGREMAERRGIDPDAPAMENRCAARRVAAAPNP
jgi:hemerythrin-like domain-containing protein